MSKKSEDKIDKKSEKIKEIEEIPNMCMARKCFKYAHRHPSVCLIKISCAQHKFCKISDFILTPQENPNYNYQINNFQNFEVF